MASTDIRSIGTPLGLRNSTEGIHRSVAIKARYLTESADSSCDFRLLEKKRLFTRCCINKAGPESVSEPRKREIEEKMPQKVGLHASSMLNEDNLSERNIEASSATSGIRVTDAYLFIAGPVSVSFSAFVVGQHCSLSYGLQVTE